MKCLAPLISFVQNKTSIAIFRPFFNRNMVRPIICAAALLGTSLAVANGFDIASGSCCQPNLEKSLLCGPICGPMTPRNSNACTSLAATLQVSARGRAVSPPAAASVFPVPIRTAMRLDLHAMLSQCFLISLGS